MAQKTSSSVGPNYQYLPYFTGLGWEELLIHTPAEDNNCYLVALDNRQISVLLSLLDQVAWCWWLWGVAFGDEAMGRVINDFTEGLKDCLMSGCSVGDLVAVLSGIRESLDGIGATIEGCYEAQTRGGRRIDDPPHSGMVETGPGEQFPDQESYFNAKCSVSNGIYDTVRGLIDWLEDNNAEMVVGGFGGITAAISLGLLFAGPVGWAAIAVESTLVGISAWAFSALFDFEDMQQAFDDVKDELVLSLYNASNEVVARSNFLAVLDTATPALTTAEKRLVQYTLSSAVLNQLFSPRADVAVYTSPSPTDCGATLAIWTFPSDGQGWTFRDDSTGGYSATGVWNSGAEAWRINLIGPGEPLGTGAVGVIAKTGLTIAVGIGNSVQFDHGGASDDIIMSRYIRVIFSDVTEQYHEAPPTAASGTVVMSIEASKTISEIEIGTGRSSQLAFDATRDVQEVRVT